MEAVNAHLTDSTALNMPVPTILIPAKKKPIKYNFRPNLAIAPVLCYVPG